jgi:hypothetical protein
MDMDNQIEKSGAHDAASQALDREWRLMNTALERLGGGGIVTPVPAKGSGRLIVALDLSGSRAESLKQARKATAAMFEAIKAIGAVSVRLVYYRGLRECRASKWHDNPHALSESMLRLSCESGLTQIARTLRVALTEKENLSGMVFVGDHCEEEPYELEDLAEKLGRKSVPLFVFHECADRNEQSLHAKPIFMRMAKLSGGVYTEFRPDSGAILRELLTTLAVFSAAGVEGLKGTGQPDTPEARRLRGSLLMLQAGDPKQAG